MGQGWTVGWSSGKRGVGGQGQPASSALASVAGVGAGCAADLAQEACHSSPCWSSSRCISWNEGRCFVSLRQQLSISLYTESGQMAGCGR